MSEYMEKHTVARLIGAPPGYVGYEEGGQLTEAVRRRPYSVVLFDEIEKAHSDVFNTLLQILDDGRLTDGKGRIVNFKNTVIIMTSNIAGSIIQEMNQSALPQEAIRARVMEELRHIFRPEFLNRVDETIIFHPLDRAQIAEIARLQLQRLHATLAERRITLEVTPAAYVQLAEEGYDPVYGARPLKRAIQQRIQNPLALKLLQSEFQPGETLIVDAALDGEFIFAHADEDTQETEDASAATTAA
jgi:ATP-dependent Clp protease ATP-binding subunit ClpB